MECGEPSPLCFSIKQSGEGSPHSIRCCDFGHGHRCVPQQIIPASASRSLRLWLPRPDMQEICHDLGVLHVGAVANGFVTRSRLFNTFQLKTSFDQQIQPLAYRPRKPWNLELRPSVGGRLRSRVRSPVAATARSPSPKGLSLPKILLEFRRVSRRRPCRSPGKS